MIRRFLITSVCALALVACGSEEPAPKASEPTAKPAAARPSAEKPSTPDDLRKAIVLSLAHFEVKDGKPVPGDARMEFLVRKGGKWEVVSFEDPDSVVFHKVMAYAAPDGPRLLSFAGSAPSTGDPGHLKLWRNEGGTLVADTLWEKHWGGKVSRMRDGEVADLFGDGTAAIAVATHDRGVVATLRPGADGFVVEEIDEKPDIFVHEIEIGDVSGDGVLEVYATPSEPNKLEGGAVQRGEVVRYVPKEGGKRTVVADLGDRHAKEILVTDMDGDGTDELYVAVEGHMDENKRLVDPVEIRRYTADTPADGGEVVATIQDRLTRFLTAGDVDGDGKQEMVAAAYSSGVWLLRPGEQGKPWKSRRIDRNSAGFEHAALLADLDGDGMDELYVASDKHFEVRRYAWDGRKLAREVIYKRPDKRSIFTWNLMPVPVEVVPEG